MKQDIQQGQRIGDTNTFTTGHYIVQKSAVKKIFESDLFNGRENFSLGKEFGIWRYAAIINSILKSC